MTNIRFMDDDHVLRVAILSLLGPTAGGEEWLKAFFAPEIVDPAEVYRLGAGLHSSDGVSVADPNDLSGGVQGSDAEILVFRRGEVTASVMDAHPRLRLVQRLGERSDVIDLDAARARRIRVSCLPRRTLIYTAEHAILLMLALGKRLVEADRAVRTGAWDRARVIPTDGVAYNWAGLNDLAGLYGKTLGIIGLGEVGAIVAGLAHRFGMTVLYSKRNRLPALQEAALGVVYAPRADLLARADFVSVHAANTPENRSMIDGDFFAAMKRGAFFVNTSRGRLVDEDALHAALASGHLGGAGLDVHGNEPRAPDDRLARLDGVILTPHCAGGSRRGILLEIQDLLDNCRASLSGKLLRHEILPQTR